MADAAGDLITLAKLNPTSPYLLAVHVREFSDVTRVEKILDLLPEGEFELMPIREWIEVARAHPTFRERYK